jgi:hypothetical protein
LPLCFFAENLYVFGSIFIYGYYIMPKGSNRKQSRGRKIKCTRGGSSNGEVLAAQEGILSSNTILPSSRFESTGTGGETARYETAVMPSAKHMSGGKRRSKKSKRSSNRRRSVKKWFGLF